MSNKAGIRLLGLIGLMVAGLLLAPAHNARAAYIDWGGWKVYSSENFQYGRKYKTYPLTYLFDNDPTTAWVFSGAKGHSWDTLDKDLGGAKYALLLVPKEPVVLDSLRVMNGYNRNAASFQRNNRVTTLRVTLYAAGSKTVKTVQLSDKMGWHSVVLPRQKVTRIHIEMVGFAPGRDNDICLSELALYDGARKIDLQMPRAVVYSDGEGEQYLPSDLLINRRGETITHAMEYETYWSPSGRYVMGRLETSKFWIADTQKPAVFFTTPKPWDEARWISDRAIALSSQKGEKSTLDIPRLKK